MFVCPELEKVRIQQWCVRYLGTAQNFTRLVLTSRPTEWKRKSLVEGGDDFCITEAKSNPNIVFHHNDVSIPKDTVPECPRNCQQYLGNMLELKWIRLCT